MIHFFIALGIIDISFDLYLSIGSESIETYIITKTENLYLAVTSSFSGEGYSLKAGSF